MCLFNSHIYIYVQKVLSTIKLERRDHCESSMISYFIRKSRGRTSLALWNEYLPSLYR